ncbi:MAG: FAD-linked oxidase C-terminal domain-containing protein [Candidatus Dormiibacterota bacterium]
MLETAVLERLRAAVGDDGIITDPTAVRTYACDGLTGRRVSPAAVVLPLTTEQVAAVVRVCADAGVPFVARGAGTGLSGGALPIADGVVVGLSRMRAILAVDLDNLQVTVQPGVTNLEVSKAVRPLGYFYAPDPSSQQVCTIGGNVAENSGGAHCLKYGFTTHHVMGATFVTADGRIAKLGGAVRDAAGYDLLGVVIGSEGTLGIVTEVVLRIVRVPESTQTILAAFTSMGDAGEAVSRIIAAGITPAAIEMMDRLAIRACEETVHAGYPDCGAALVVELDGPAVESDAFLSEVIDTCNASGAIEIRVAADDAERALIWKARKAAFASMGRISPSYYVQDGVIPRTRLRDVLEQIDTLSESYGLRVANVFHAGDGNLHPLVLYDDAQPRAGEAALELAGKILEACIAAGGSITGEHGVGSDKACYMPKMFSPSSIDVMGRVRDAFDPRDLCNPGKALPTPRLCGEVPGMYRPHPAELAGLAERM